MNSLKTYIPKIALVNDYERLNWSCDYCHANQVYVGGGRLMCAETDCDNFFGKDDVVEHISGSFSEFHNTDNGGDMSQAVLDENLLKIISNPIRRCGQCNGTNLQFQAFVKQDEVTKEYVFTELVENDGLANCGDCNTEVYCTDVIFKSSKPTSFVGLE